MSELGKVFLLDDDRIFLDLYQNFLEAKGYNVFATDNAYKFLLYGHEINPDVIFLDVNMPQMNGWEVLQRIVNDSVMQDTPVVMLTVNHDEDLGTAKGVAHFVYKPLEIEMMNDILESYCVGNRNHDVLLLEDYEPMFNTAVETVKKHNRSCFLTHSLKAAKKYLQKNQPKKICVRYNPEKFEEARQELPADNLFRIDSLADFEKILNN